ncbi:MAG: sulfatase-like hydrolase/transferase [Phycisphaerae bacterium]|nr:sulfatase-like hydrolase/transferase [Phycisphaerae bacterium]
MTSHEVPDRRATALKGQRIATLAIIADDHGIGDPGWMGNPSLKTPKLDKMPVHAARRTRFPTSPVRIPTRGCLLPGRYNYRTRAISTPVGRAMTSPIRPSDDLCR